MSEFKYAPVSKGFRNLAYSLNTEKFKNLNIDDVSTWINWGGTWINSEFKELTVLAQKLANDYYSSEEWREKASEFLMLHAAKVYEALESLNRTSSMQFQPALSDLEKIYHK